MEKSFKTTDTVLSPKNQNKIFSSATPNQFQDLFESFSSEQLHILKEYAKIKLGGALARVDQLTNYTEAVQRCYDGNGAKLEIAEENFDGLKLDWTEANKNECKDEKVLLGQALFEQQKGGVRRTDWTRGKFNEGCDDFDIFDAVEFIGKVLGEEE